MTNYSLKKDDQNWLNRIGRNELILQSLSEGVCVIDKENRLSFVNKSAAKMLGWKPEDLLFQPCEEVFFSKEWSSFSENQTVNNPIQFALLEGESVHVNSETFYRWDKTGFLVEYVCVPLRENDEVVGVALTFQDISERSDLENAVDAARKSALESAQEKANFLANMSHEIRTPLNGIMGISEILAQTNLSIGQKDYVETIKTSAHLLLDIVNDILDFSKIEAGKLELEEVDFDLHEIIIKIIKLHSPQAVKKKISLEFEVHKTVETYLRGDAGRLRQVVNNLLGNALKFTENGKVLLKVLSDKNNFLRFEVSDTGIGIESKNCEKIFEPFAQANISTTRQFGGTGLGLAISKQIIQMMGGEIGVESQLGKGSKFWFTAQFKFAKNLIDNKLENVEQNLAEITNFKILVVDDDPINQKIVSQRLQQKGIKADLAENGIEALKTLKNNKYDLILMDCRMPKMDGFETTRRIRSLENEVKNIKIIAMTASVTENERNRCIIAGMNDYLVKPMSIEVLEKALEKHLSFKIPKKKLDEEENIVQHPLTNIIEAKVLQNFIEIEARGDRNFALETLNIYLKHSEKQIFELKSGFDNRNFDLVKNKVHALRGSSGSIGLTYLFEEFSNLEQLAFGDWTEAEKILDRILKQFTELKTKVSHLSEFGD